MIGPSTTGKGDQHDFCRPVERFAAAAAAGDGDALADLFTPDGTYDDYFFGPCSGRAAIKQMLAHFAEGGRKFRWEFYDPVLSGQTGYASYRFSFESTRQEAKGSARGLRWHRPLRPRGRPHQALLGGFDRGMALAQQAFEPERLVKIALKYANALKSRPEWAGHA